MTTKIMIDGIDIEHICSDVDCYYKQLKRKEQEREDYKTLAKQHLADFFEKEKECEELTNKNNMLETELDQIKLLLEGKNTQYSQLKAENKIYKKMLDNSESRVALTDIKTGEREELGEKAQNYKQALDEIEEIAARNLCGEDFECALNCECDWKDVKDIINNAKDGE